MHRADRLRVLTEAGELVVQVYRLSGGFPFEERFELRSQVGRAVVSIGTNIVEGAGFGTKAGFARHLRIARGSAAEVQYQMRIAMKIGCITREDYSVIHQSCENLRKVLTGLIRHQQAGNSNPA